MPAGLDHSDLEFVNVFLRVRSEENYSLEDDMFLDEYEHVHNERLPDFKFFAELQNHLAKRYELVNMDVKSYVTEDGSIEIEQHVDETNRLIDKKKIVEETEKGVRVRMMTFIINLQIRTVTTPTEEEIADLIEQ